MKLDERCNWHEDDLGQPQSENILMIERKIYVTDWLAMLVAYLLGVATISILVMVFGGMR